MASGEMQESGKVVIAALRQPLEAIFAVINNCDSVSNSGTMSLGRN
jgi:hypothetical protein